MHIAYVLHTLLCSCIGFTQILYTAYTALTRRIAYGLELDVTGDSESDEEVFWTRSCLMSFAVAYNQAAD